MKPSNRLATYTVYLVLTFSLFTLSCSDYLDVQPDNRTAINSVEKVKQLLVGAYVWSDFYSFAEIMSDNAYDKGFGINADRQTNVDAWKWNSTYTQTANDEGAPAAFWSTCYKSIAQANQALQSIAELSPSEQVQASPYKGEALILRAYSHFMLVNLWAKHYDPSTANQDMGVPYVEKVEGTLLGNYQRNSVKEVYDRIERDLLEGLSLLNNSAFDVPSFHFNVNATKAFAIRLYLFKREWDKVVMYANQILPTHDTTIDLQKSVKNIAVKLRNYVYSSGLSFADQALYYGNKNEPAVLLTADAFSLWGRDFRGGSKYGISPSVADKIVLPFYSAGLISPIYSGPDVHYFFSKFYEQFEYTDINARTGYAHIATPLFTTDEVLLSRAEAYAMLGDTTGAVIDIKAFRSARMNSGYDATTSLASINAAYTLYDTTKPSENYTTESNANEYHRAMSFAPNYSLPETRTQRNVLRAVINARRLCFWQEGLRWFDVRRLNITVVHKNYDNSIYGVLTPNDKRQLLPIPEEATSLGLPNNPR